MIASRRSVLTASGILAATTIVALGMTTVAGSTPATATTVGGCTATVRVDSQWGSGASGGQVVTFTVANTSSSTASRWTVTWPLADGQRIVSSWNTSIGAAGGTATATNTSYNGVLTSGASTTFGVQLAGPTSAPTPGCANDAAPPTTASPPSGADVTVREADNQRTVTLFVGQTLGVALAADYLPVTATGGALTPVSTSGGYPTGQPLLATLRAVTPGTAELTTRTDHACLHATPPCALPTVLWTVRITVVDLPPTDAGQTVVVTAPDNQRDLRLRVGDTLVVSLASNYLPPTVTPAGVVVPHDVTGGYPTGQPLVARYVAAAPGQVDVATITDNLCRHQPTPCPSPQVRWVVHVTVTT
ncbi:Cellulose binding domain-containing protein [Micromonospora matsumotoense]|uniref:Cellulose binding domain-containing protein n=1 Tax=Micromonospora matsumotoense TaxID=121616 RepID=A0A1C4UJR9_9ACTN|nr:cellulose binding domain-containing protein [Micromonospora matsumotoense]SCE71904.1 Cellulose binding domain-containing protein [Micromonospora matsumotoense]